MSSSFRQRMRARAGASCLLARLACSVPLLAWLPICCPHVALTDLERVVEGVELNVDVAAPLKEARVLHLEALRSSGAAGTHTRTHTRARTHASQWAYGERRFICTPSRASERSDATDDSACKARVRHASKSAQDTQQCGYTQHRGRGLHSAHRVAALQLAVRVRWRWACARIMQWRQACARIVRQRRRWAHARTRRMTRSRSELYTCGLQSSSVSACRWYRLAAHAEQSKRTTCVSTARRQWPELHRAHGMHQRRRNGMGSESHVGG